MLGGSVGLMVLSLAGRQGHPMNRRTLLEIQFGTTVIFFAHVIQHLSNPRYKPYPPAFLDFHGQGMPRQKGCLRIRSGLLLLCWVFILYSCLWRLWRLLFLPTGLSLLFFTFVREKEEWWFCFLLLFFLFLVCSTSLSLILIVLCCFFLVVWYIFFFRIEINLMGVGVGRR